MRASIIALGIATFVAISSQPGFAAQTCGNGIVEGGEECDPGGDLFCNGNPSQGACVNGSDCNGGVNCYFETSCCKFNCQFVGQGADCFDGNSCTLTDHCDQVGRCVGIFVADGTPCSDGVFCNGTDTCAAGECDSHGGDPCSAATDCLTTCNEDADACLSTPNVPCGDDGNACTDDVCNNVGTCTHPPLPIATICRPLATVCDLPEICDGSGAPCPGDTFVPNGTVCGDACTAGGTCQAGQCTGGVPVLCEDNDVCNGVATCDSLLGCLAGTPLDCVDGDSCTSDPCDPVAGCLPHEGLPDGTPCQDGDRCTSIDLCENNVCVGGPTFLARKKAKVVNDAVINRDIAAFDPNGLAAMGRNSFMPDGTTITGDKVKIGKSSSVADVKGNRVTHILAEIRGTQDTVTLPLQGPFCAIDPIVCGGQSIIVPELGIATVDPGTYNIAKIGEGAIVNFKPGTYSFCSFLTGRGAQVNFLGSVPSLVRVDKLFRLGNGTIFGPAAGVPWPTVHARVLAKFGADELATTHVVAPEGKVKVGRGTVFDGAVCGKELKGAWHVTLTCTE